MPCSSNGQQALECFNKLEKKVIFYKAFRNKWIVCSLKKRTYILLFRMKLDRWVLCEFCANMFSFYTETDIGHIGPF